MPALPVDSLTLLLEQLSQGNMTVDQARQQLETDRRTETLNSVYQTSSGDVRLDLDRARRCGYPEVIYGPGKSCDSVVQAFEQLRGHGQNSLVTRCTPEQMQAVRQRFPDVLVNETARTVRWNAEAVPCGQVVVVAAGTSDRPVAEEVVETLAWMEVQTTLLLDLGVAGPQRLLNERHQLAGAQAVVVVAGMEGALPSVVAGWVACPVIAVPTSVGYGAAFGGMTALLGMLNSCAANVAVVNIDAGFKGGYLAGMIARQAVRKDSPTGIDPANVQS